MVYKRKRSTSRKRFNPKRRRRYRRWRRARLYTVPMIHRFRRTLQLSETTLSTSPIYGNRVFRLSDITTVGEWSAMFDSFKLTGVKLKFYYGLNSFDATTVGVTMGYLHLALDWNDQTNCASLDEIREYATYKCYPLGACHGRGFYFRPKISTEYFVSGVSTGYGYTNANPWVDFANSASVPYYGLKYAIENGGNNNGVLRIVGVYYFKTKMNK